MSEVAARAQAAQDDIGHGSQRSRPARRVPIRGWDRQSGPRRRLRVVDGRGPRHRRRVGLGEVGHLAGDHGPAAAQLQGLRLDQAARRGAARQERRGDDQGPRPRVGHGLPGPAVRSHPDLHRRLPARRGVGGSSEPVQVGGREAGGRAARDRRDSQRQVARQVVPPRVLRWNAPTGDDRHGDRQRPGRHHRRRADHGARCHHPGSGSRRAQARPEGDRFGGDHDHPRPRCGRRDRRPRPGDVRRTFCRDGHGRRRVLPAADAVHDRPARVGAATRRSREAGAGADRGQSAVTVEPAAGMQVRAPLPDGHRGV